MEMLELVSFRVTNFRNVIDSGWIEVERITAIIGPNESGKSNLCEALFRLKPYDEESAFDINFDWPVDRWEAKSANAFAISARFRVPADLREGFLEAIRKVGSSSRRPPRPKLSEDASEIVVTVSRRYDGKYATEVEGISGDHNASALWRWSWPQIPKFVYIDDYGAVGNRVELGQLAQKLRDNGWDSLTAQEQTIKIILDLAKIDIDDFLKKAETAQGRTLRTFDKKSASAYLTRKFQDLWKQKRVDFDIEIDGPTLNILVRDDGLYMPVPLDKRSTGFRWYVGFAWRFTHATAGDFSETVLLLEEPGIHLHPAAQVDLLRLFETLSESNQLIYTTHLPTLVDPGFPERIRIVELRDHHAHVTHGLVSRSRAPMLVIEAALGLSPHMSGLLGSRRTLIVEGPEDATILLKLSSLMSAAGETGLADDVYLWAAQGASKTPMYAGFLIGHEWPGGALLDGDEEGRKAQKKIKDLYRYAKDSAFFTGTISAALGRDSEPLTIEDVLGAELYTELVAAAYRVQFSVMDLDDNPAISLVRRIDAALERRGHGPLDKSRVMNVLLKRFSTWRNLTDVPEQVRENATLLFEFIDKRISALRTVTA